MITCNLVLTTSNGQVIMAPTVPETLKAIKNKTFPQNCQFLPARQERYSKGDPFFGSSGGHELYVKFN